MMQQRMATVLCVPVFCLAVWALSPSAHAAGNLPPVPQSVNADETDAPDEGNDEFVISDEVDDDFDVLLESANPCVDPELGIGSPTATTGSLVCFYPIRIVEVRDTLADGYAAYIQWDYGRDKHSTRNRSQVGGNGKSLI